MHVICSSVDNVIPFISLLASGGWDLLDDLRGWQHLAGPNSQPCTLESQDEKRPASRVYQDGLYHEVVMNFLDRTTEAV